MNTLLPFHPHDPQPPSLRLSRVLVPVLGLLILIAVPIAAAGETSTPLFNGQNLDGWEVYLENVDGPVTDQKIFQVVDGNIHVYRGAPDQSDQPFGMLVSTADYGSYRLSLEYRWGTGKFGSRAGPSFSRDAGLLYHVQPPFEIWPASVECQIQYGDTGDIWVIKTQVTSTVHPANRNFCEPDQGGVEMTRGDSPDEYNRFFHSASYEIPGWNHVEIVVEGDHATYLVNGQVANKAMHMKHWDTTTESWIPLTKGRILLQAEGAEIFYRNIVITPLD